MSGLPSSVAKTTEPSVADRAARCAIFSACAISVVVVEEPPNFSLIQSIKAQLGNTINELIINNIMPFFFNSERTFICILLGLKLITLLLLLTLGQKVKVTKIQKFTNTL